MTKVMRKEAQHTQRQDRASGVPLEILEHLPPKPGGAGDTSELGNRAGSHVALKQQQVSEDG